MSLRLTRLFLSLLLALGSTALWSPPPASAQQSFTAFESGPVRPIVLSSDGKRLYVVNTPDDRLEVFAVKTKGINHIRSIPVGLEPVALAMRGNNEIWVVNHLSDSVSIVTDDRDGNARVTRTLLVGDEPRDIVFAGPGGNRAFITTAHRGQRRMDPALVGVPGAGNPRLTDDANDNGAGIGRADVWVFNATLLGDVFGGTPLEIVELFGDTPRALAASPDGNTVYAAVFLSGNQTAVVSEGRVCNGFGGAGSCAGDGVTSPNGLGGGQMPGGNPGPSATLPTAPSPNVAAPEAGLVVKFDNVSGQWRDELSRNWSNGIRFHLPDHDVFAIDATSLTQTNDYEHVGTTLFNMVTNPVNGNLYVSNTDSENLTRFEGPGGAGSTVQGKLALSRITVVTPGTGVVRPRHLNRHIDYSQLKAPAGTKTHSLATPLQMVISSDGTKLYVAAFGSSKVGVLDTADLENDALWDNVGPEFDPTVASANYISVSGGGPSGLALDEAHGRLYVATRFNNGVSIVDTVSGTEISNVPFYNPEPASITVGRPMLYDAFKTSSNGETSCSSCHIFGDFDALAWDLGNPDGGIGTNPNTINLVVAAGDQNGGAANDEFHPMKGPMTTQTMRGLVVSGHMHWRGDRVDGFFGLDAPDNNDADLSFRNFIVAFDGLVGGDIPPTDPGLQADMQDFSDFMLQVVLPPNPIRNLDNALASDQLPGRNVQAGRDFFFAQHGGNICADGICSFPGTKGVVGFACNGCHRLNAGLGFFGTNGFSSFENELQIFKIPHLRNLYQKVGMFGMPDVDFNLPGYDNSFRGDQVRGTGFLHDGSTDTLFRFFTADVFANNPGNSAGFDGGDPQRRNVEAFMLSFDSDLPPIVGQQVTLNMDNVADAATLARIALLETRAGTAFTSAVFDADPGTAGTQATTECQVVAHVVENNSERGYLFDPALGVDGEYLPDTTGDPNLAPAALQALATAAGQEVTYTCVPPGSGARMALDRDGDGFLDGDERAAETDPDEAASFPGACANGIDDDGDGDIDLADAGCRSSIWNNERPQCNDGRDNDGDGKVDLVDGDCLNASDKIEQAQAASCGLGSELAVVAAALLAVRRRRRSA